MIGVMETECVEWQGSVATNGYGRFKLMGRHHQAHRLSYELLVGPIPPGLVIDHLCKNKRCINPEHLEAVTNVENLMRGEGIQARNKRKTHCNHGHPLSGDNLHISATTGERICKACRRVSQRKSDARRRRQHREANPLPPKVACRNGHPHTEEGLYVAPNGTRTCKLCRRESQRRHRARASATS